MIAKELEAQILRLHDVEKWKVGTIATQLRVHHATVRRVLAHAGHVAVARKMRPSRIDPFIPMVKEVLAKHPTLQASRLYRMVQERGYVGGPDHFRHMIALYRPRPQAEAYQRLRTLPGEQGQVDWGHFGHIVTGDAKRPLMAFVMVLSYSRAIYLRFYQNARSANFLDGHQRAFHAFGGVPKVLLYDNLKSAVLERQGDLIKMNPTLLDFAGHHRFEVRPVAVYRGNQKGRVERAIQYIRHAFFAGRTYANVADLNHQADAWCVDQANQRPCPENRTMTVGAALELERPYLVALPADTYPVEEQEVARTGKTPYVRFDLNDYSVPHVHVHKTLSVRASEHDVRVFDGTACIATHQRTYGKGEQIEASEHVDALKKAKAHARQMRNSDRLVCASPLSSELLQHILQTRGSISQAVTVLTHLLDDYGAGELEIALAEVIENGTCHVHAVRQVLERRARQRGELPPVPIELPDDPRVRDAIVVPHSLSTYDALEDTEVQP